MNKSEAIELLVSEGWTKADAIRALAVVDFNINPDELTIRRAISPFAGGTLIERQRLQAAQKGMVTKLSKKIEQIQQEYVSKLPIVLPNNDTSAEQIKSLISQNQELIRVNEQLKKDNKNLKNIVDNIKLKLAIDTKKILQYKDSEIRKAVVKLFKSTLG